MQRGGRESIPYGDWSYSDCGDSDGGDDPSLSDGHPADPGADGTMILASSSRF